MDFCQQEGLTLSSSHLRPNAENERTARRFGFGRIRPRACLSAGLAGLPYIDPIPSMFAFRSFPVHRLIPFLFVPAAFPGSPSLAESTALPASSPRPAVDAPFFATMAAAADSDSVRAREVFEEMERRQDLVTYEVSTQTMRIFDRRGRERTRVMSTWTRRDPARDTRDQLIVFSDPGSVRGSAFLTLTREGVDEQKLYLPGVGRIQTILSEQGGDSFMGSDFTYDDLSGQDSEDYRFVEMEETETHWVLTAEKREPREEDRATRFVFSVAKETYALEGVEYVNAAGNAVRRLTSSEFSNLTGDLWSPSRMVMEDLESGTRTELEWSGRRLNEPVEEWRFTERGLLRGV